MFRLVQFSDTHLREGHGRHQRNFSRAVRRAGRFDLAVITGDLSVDGADHKRDLKAARARFENLRGDWRAIPGNHDIGEEPASPRQRQPVSEARRARYRSVFGEDFWVMDVPGWRLVGLNVHIFGTGWDAEVDQWQMIERAIEQCGERRLGIFIHKPLFLTKPDEPEDLLNCVTALGRDRMLSLSANGGIAFFASGHLHQSRALFDGGVHHIWSPATANPANRLWASDVIRNIGFTTFDLSPDGQFKASFSFI